MKTFVEKPKEVEAYQFYARNYPDTPGVGKIKLYIKGGEEVYYYIKSDRDLPEGVIAVSEADWIYKDEFGYYTPAESEWFMKHFKQEGEDSK